MIYLLIQNYQTKEHPEIEVTKELLRKFCLTRYCNEFLTRNYTLSKLKLYDKEKLIEIGKEIIPNKAFIKQKKYLAFIEYISKFSIYQLYTYIYTSTMVCFKKL